MNVYKSLLTAPVLSLRNTLKKRWLFSFLSRSVTLGSSGSHTVMLTGVDSDMVKAYEGWSNVGALSFTSLMFTVRANVLYNTNTFVYM